MGDWHGIGVRPNVAQRRMAFVAVLLATSLCVACTGGGDRVGADTAAGGTSQDARVVAPSSLAGDGVGTSAEPLAVPVDAGGQALAATPPGVGLIQCPAVFATWATTASGLDVDTAHASAEALVPDAWKLESLGAPSCSFTGVRDGADPLTGAPRRISTLVMAYLSESGAVLEAAYADTRTALEGSSLTFASESSDAGLHAAQYFHDDGGVVDATLTVAMRLDPPFAADAGLTPGVGLLIIRGTHRMALPEE